MMLILQFLEGIHLGVGVLGAVVGGLIGSLFPIPFFSRRARMVSTANSKLAESEPEDPELVEARKQIHEIAVKRFPELAGRR